VTTTTLLAVVVPMAIMAMPGQDKVSKTKHSTAWVLDPGNAGMNSSGGWGGQRRIYAQLVIRMQIMGTRWPQTGLRDLRRSGWARGHP